MTDAPRPAAPPLPRTGIVPLVIDGPRVFGPCSKCAGAEVQVIFHEGKRHCNECRAIESCRYNKACGDDGRKGEHLVVTCQRCHFAWIEPTESIP